MSRFLGFAVCGVALLGLGACSASTRASAGASYSVGARGDARLADDIRAGVAQDARLSSASRDIQIEVKGGVATLSGKVASDNERHLIADVAERLAGEGHVKDRLVVQVMPAGSAEPATPFLERPQPDLPAPPPEQPKDKPYEGELDWE